MRFLQCWVHVLRHLSDTKNGFPTKTARNEVLGLNGTPSDAYKTLHESYYAAILDMHGQLP